MEITPWYFDWKFWTAVVAWLGFLMNIYPWVKKKLKGTKLSLSTYPLFSLSHKIGITNIQWHLRIENTGGSDIDISKVYLHVRDNQGEIKLPAFSFFEKTSTDQTIMAGLRLKPGEMWQAYVWFSEDLSREDRRELRNIENAARQAINISKTQDQNRLFHVLDPELIGKINSFFLRLFKFKPCEYTLAVSVQCTQGKTFDFPGYRFILYESDIAEHRSHTERYITGEGVTWYSDISTWMHVPVTKG